MRKVHTITLDGIDNGERVKAINIISKALSTHFGKSCAVFQEGHASECAIDAIPASVSVFVIGNPQKIDTTTSDNDESVQLITNPSAPMSVARSAATGEQVQQQKEAGPL